LYLSISKITLVTQADPEIMVLTLSTKTFIEMKFFNQN
jgi:hypothetical protein